MSGQIKNAIVAGVGVGLGDEVCKQLISLGYRVAGFSRSNSCVLNKEFSVDDYLHVCVQYINCVIVYALCV